MHTPRFLSAHMWWNSLKSVWQQIDEENLGLISAGVAFFGMLAVFPGLAALIAIWGLLADPTVVRDQIALLEGIVPSDVYGLLDVQMQALTSAGIETLSWATAISTFLALWSARAGVGALIRGLNTIYDAPNRASLSHYFSALVLTLALIGVSLVALTSVVVAPVVLAFLPLGQTEALIFELVRWTAAIAVLGVGLSVIYRFGPNRATPRKRWVTPGAVLVVVFWALASAGFSVYLSNFGTYNEVYGSIGAVVALLMWLYISAFLILLGGALNVQLERRLSSQPGS